MRVRDLLGREYTVKVSKYKLKPSSKSAGQESLKDLLKEYYASSVILEEFCIPHHNLYLDFYVPERNIAFEFDGEQHKKFVKHFHGTVDGLKRQKSNDSIKEQWCEFNKIKLIRFSEVPETIDEFKKVIYG